LGVKLFRNETVQTNLKQLSLISIASAPVLIYYYYISMSHPVVAGWTNQNITFAPELLDFLISFSPVLFLAVPGAVIAFKSNNLLLIKIAIWAVFCISLVYLPISLQQRRFMIGLIVPLVILSVIAIEEWRLKSGASQRKSFWSYSALFLLATPSILIIYFVSFSAIQSKDPSIYLSKYEREAFAWIDNNLPNNSLILSGGEIGNFIPAYTIQRVLFGHHHETVNANYWLESVSNFYSSDTSNTDQIEFLNTNQVDYIFYGRREKEIGAQNFLESFDLVFNQGDVQIFAAHE
ncbi:MAG: hypothetical protein N2D54_05470, partial [Chloroflexota bacterium]